MKNLDENIKGILSALSSALPAKLITPDMHKEYSDCVNELKRHYDNHCDLEPRLREKVDRVLEERNKLVEELKVERESNAALKRKIKSS